MREVLPNGTLIQGKDDTWVASVALEEYNPYQERSPWQNNANDKKYTFLQANGKTKDEAISNLHKMAWDMLNKTGDEILRLNKEIDVVKSRSVNLGCWLDGTKKGEVVEYVTLPIGD